MTTTGAAAITSAGPNNAANVWNRRNLFTYQDDLQITRGKHQISAGVWFQPVQDNENTASRQLGQASFTSLTTFLQGTTSSFQVVPSPTELGWRSKFGAWYIEDNVRVRRNFTLRLGVRNEFTTGWNEVKNRGSQLHHRRARGVADGPPGGQLGVHEEPGNPFVRAASGFGVGRVRQRQDGGPARDSAFTTR